ncbi:50S ribosomal protein L29 [Patescibacteria group bacterium]
MKRQEIAKLHNSTVKELSQKIEELQKELVIVRMEIKLGKQKNLKKGSSIRKDIARIKTIISQKNLSKNQEKESSSKSK